jgi:hypothetical protein
VPLTRPSPPDLNPRLPLVPLWYRLLRPIRPDRPRTGNDGDAGDAQGRIDTGCRSAGGRKVAGSNPAAPTRRKPASKRAFGISSPGARAGKRCRGTGVGTKRGPQCRNDLVSRKRASQGGGEKRPLPIHRPLDQPGGDRRNTAEVPARSGYSVYRVWGVLGTEWGQRIGTCERTS